MNSDFVVAVHGLVYLKHKGCIASSEELAKNICTNPARVRKVMTKMKKMGLVTTKEGNVGGYCGCKDLGKTSLATIVQGLSAKIIDIKWHSGCHDLNCLVSSGMAGIMTDIFMQLDERCLKELSNITITQIEKKIFSKKK